MDGRREQLRAEVQRIEATAAHEYHRWIEREEAPQAPADPEATPADELADYYRTKRLEFQAGYFADRAGRHTRMDVRTRHLAPTFFFLSVGAVLLHFGYELYRGHERAPDGPSKFLMLLAAGLPVISGGVRTFRSTHEFGRNTSRYRAKQAALKGLAEIFHKETDPGARFRQMWYCEQILEFEHHEWSRLMCEAEWFA